MMMILTVPGGKRSGLLGSGFGTDSSMFFPPFNFGYGHYYGEKALSFQSKRKKAQPYPSGMAGITEKIAYT
jgi:hypothetical protein